MICLVFALLVYGVLLISVFLTQMESLKRHIETETKEKKKYQQMYYALQEDLRKKVCVLLYRTKKKTSTDL